MIISYKDKCIFFHNPKTAGRSIQVALRQRLMIKLELGYNCLEDTAYGMCSGMEDSGYTMSHVCPKELKKGMEGDFGKQTFEKFFKFTFVRNPWDRKVSMYHFYKQNCDATKDFDTPFEKWIRLLHNLHVNGEWEFNIMPQHKWSHIDGEKTVDFIGRYENLKSDFEFVKKTLALPNDCRLTHENASKHHDYREYYTDETKQMLAEIFAEDIKLFGYTFGGRE
jgi:hypothetical protein